MRLSRASVASALTKLTLKPGARRQELAKEIAAYLLTEHQTSELDSLLRDLITLRAEHGIVELTAISAHPLTPSIRTDIEQEVRRLFTNVHEIIINERTDLSVVGGLRLEIVDQQLDTTVRTKLNHFKSLVSTE